MDDLGIIEASDHLEDGIDSANMRQESISETGTSGGTSCQTSNIVHRQVSRYSRLGFVLFAKPVISSIRNNDTSFLGVDSGIREVGRVTKGALGDGLEQRRLADISKTNLGLTVSKCS